MKFHPMRQMVLNSLLIAVCASSAYAMEATIAQPSLTIERAAHFLSADGRDVVIEPGRYVVEAADPWLRLIPDERKDAILIVATSISHRQNVDAPFLRLAVDGKTQVVQLLLPGGTGYEAVGTERGIRSRAVRRGKSAASSMQRKAASRRSAKNTSPTSGLETTVQGLTQQVKKLQATIHSLHTRMSKLEAAVYVSNGGLTLQSAGKIKLNASVLEVSSGTVKVNAGTATFTGVVNADSVVTKSVVSSSYTPGAGNVW